jgi:transcriptional regulator with XRE-family HTH domain
MSKLGDLIYTTRKTKGISQETLGNLVDYGRPNILNIEAGKLKPSNDLLERIGKALDIPYKRLIALKILDYADEEVKHWLLVELQRE